MPDILIRDLPSEVLAALDTKASTLGLSRVEFVRRALVQEAGIGSESCTEAHLSNLLALLPDLDNEEVMGNAWR
jgi:hypothetical protein